MIYLYTDFSVRDFYTGQMHAAILQQNAEAKVVDLFHYADARDIEGSARLLARLYEYTPAGAVIACVVDPGVGGSRKPLIIEVGGRWLVGPDNGLFSLILRNNEAAVCREILWRPERLSNTFHGRDLFAPVAAMLDSGEMPGTRFCEPWMPDWPLQSQRIIYRDHYGNLMTGLLGASIDPDTVFVVNGHPVVHANRFSAVEKDQTFWMINSIGLVEIAANLSDASERLKASVGDDVLVQA